MRRFLVVFLSLIPAPAVAELVELQNVRRTPFAEGKSFGKTGPYDIIRADGVFQLDPKDPRNRGIVDLDLAPKNAKGLVEFVSEIVILAPKDPAKGNGALFYDVNNRGNKLAVGFFNLRTAAATIRPIPAMVSFSVAATPSFGAAGSANCCRAAIAFS